MVDDEQVDSGDQQGPRPLPASAIAGPEEAVVQRAIRVYIWGAAPLDYSRVTRQFRRDLVEKFVRFELDGLPAARFWRVRILADLYYLAELVPGLRMLMNHRESTSAESERSVVCTIILEEVGDQQAREYAAQYYEHLVARPRARPEALLKCLGVLGDAVSPDSLKSRMGHDIDVLQHEEASDAEAGVERRALEEILDNDFYLIAQANLAHRRVAAMAGSEQRLRELIRIYLELTDDGGADYLACWTQRVIRRFADINGPVPTIAAFRAVAQSLGELPEEDRIFAAVRCCNAIEFFGGQLEPAETTFMRRHRGRQRDPLSYVPPPATWEESREPEELQEDVDSE